MTSTPCPELHWKLLRFDALAPSDLYDLLRLRAEVFVVEQACAYLDPDGKDCDPQVWHLLGRDAQGRLLAYLRLLPPGLSYDEASLGRVVTSPSARGSGLGHRLMEQALPQLARLWPGSDIQIGAQAHLADFYRRHGFEVCSDGYLEDGIPHVHMRRAASA